MQYHQSTSQRTNNEDETDYDMAHIVSVLSYITLIGWLAALVIYGHHKSTLASFHLRQSLGLIITAAILSFIPLIGWLLNLAVIIAWFVGLYQAVLKIQQPIPILGKFYQRHLDFIR